MEIDPSDIENQRLNEKLDALFAAYREACPAPDLGPDFMPLLWQQIEARRTFANTFQRWAQVLVTAAAAVCLLLGILSTTSRSRPSAIYSSTYIETLAAENPPDSLSYLETVSVESWGGGNQR
jgi:hypothetical protein